MISHDGAILCRARCIGLSRDRHLHGSVIHLTVCPEEKLGTRMHQGAGQCDMGKERNKPARKSGKSSKNNRMAGKRHRAKQEISRVQAISFHVSEEAFDPKCVIVGDASLLREEEKMLFKNETGIDKNWVPREGMHSDLGTPDLTNQVRGGLILSEAILQFGKHCALRATLANPMEFKTVNGHPGIVVAAKLLQERAGMFAKVQLKPLDAFVWTTFSVRCTINHIRVKHWGKFGTIPEGGSLAWPCFIQIPHSTRTWHLLE
jgi:hypothetical protein